MLLLTKINQNWFKAKVSIKYSPVSSSRYSHGSRAVTFRGAECRFSVLRGTGRALPFGTAFWYEGGSTARFTAHGRHHGTINGGVGQYCNVRATASTHRQSTIHFQARGSALVPCICAVMLYVADEVGHYGI